VKILKRIFAISSFIYFANISYAYANAGVPMIAFYLPPAWFALVPIILIETLVAVKKYSLPIKKSLFSVSAANVISTLVGIPITWVIWASLEGAFFGGVLGSHPISWAMLSVTVQAAWLLPYEEHLWWMGPLACLVLSFVFFAVSVAVEYQVVKIIFKDQRRELLRLWMLRSNIYSYILLFLLSSILITFYKELGSIIRLFDPIVDLLWEVVFKIAEFMN
jgi:hypothetical protein